MRLLILTGTTNDIPLSCRASVTEERSQPPTSTDFVTSVKETEEEFENFLSSELCIKVTDDSSQVLRSNNSGEGSEEDFLLDIDLSDSTCTNEDVTHDALKYLAGYIAFKCKNIDGCLGIVTEKLQPDTKLSTGQDWISIISKGGLTSPSPEWLAALMEFEIIFASFHGQHFSKCNKVMETLTSIIQSKFPEIHWKIIALYVRTRSFIRIRHFNKMPKWQVIKKNAAAKRNLQWI